VRAQHSSTVHRIAVVHATLPVSQMMTESGAPHYLRSFFLGGLVAYSANLPSLFRHAARQVGQILTGAKPGEIPFYRATKFDLVINLKTAKALGLTVPPTVLVRADEIIE